MDSIVVDVSLLLVLGSGVTGIGLVDVANAIAGLPAPRNDE